VAEAIGDGQLLAFVAEQRAPREAAARLIALARERGATDDASVVAAFVRAAPWLGRGQTAALLALGATAVGAVGWLVWEALRYWQGGG
jgi:serine/threonine protein phosphatase PrpC